MSEERDFQSKFAYQTYLCIVWWELVLVKTVSYSGFSGKATG